MRNEGMVTDQKSWKVGELAKLTGITVRTLHHYDQFGLLSPSMHSDAGHRLYTEADISKLQQIMSLKKLGFPLDQIKELIENPNYDPSEAIRMQLEHLNEQIRIQEDLRSRLEELREMVSTQQDVTAEKLIKIIEVTRMTHNCCTPEQMERLKKHCELLGPERIKEIQNGTTVLVAKVREAIENGRTPDTPEAIQLAKRSRELYEMFTNGDPEITKLCCESCKQENAGTAMQCGTDVEATQCRCEMDSEICQYISEAMSNI